MAIQETSPSDDLMHDDSIPDEHVHLSDDEDSGNDHLPKDNVRKDWWKPLPEEERPATPEPTWTIPSSNVSDVKNNWASALVSTYETPAENSLFAKTRDMMTFINWYCHQVNKTVLTQADFEGQAYEVVKAFYLDVKFYIDRHDSPSHRKEVKTHMQILSVVRIKAYSRYRYDFLSEIVLQRADFQEHTIAEKYFKNLYPSDFEDLNLLLRKVISIHLPVQTNRCLSMRMDDTGGGGGSTSSSMDFTIIEFLSSSVLVDNNDRKIMRFNEIYKFSDGTLTRIRKHWITELRNSRLSGSIWATKDKTDLPEPECFVGGRVRDIDYRLLQRTE
ncbi:hypothetical protein Tco_1504514 [Tanacetum coccineum]